MLGPVIVDLDAEVSARDVQVVIAACNDAISEGECLPETAASDAPPRAVAVARAADRGVRVVRIEVRLASDDEGAPIVRELVFGRRDPLRERWRSVGLAIATLVGEGERAREQAAEEEEPPLPPVEVAPEPPQPEAAPPPASAPELEEEAPELEAPEPEAPEPEAPDPEDEGPAQREPFEHRSLFIGVGGVTGPGFGAGAWRAGGVLRATWQASSGLSVGAALGQAWRTSERDFTAQWLSLEAGLGYRLSASDATSFGLTLLGGVQRASFEVLAAGVARSEALWNPRGGVELDARWRASPGFGVWAALGVGTVGRSSRLFVAADRDPIQAGALDAAAALGLGWWLD